MAGIARFSRISSNAATKVTVHTPVGQQLANKGLYKPRNHPFNAT